MDELKPDWDPRAPEVLENQIAAYDRMRKTCPVAYSDFLHWSIFRHADIMRIITDHETFSSNVSSRVSVPNSMDPPRHTPYRQLIEPYFSPDAMAAFEPVCHTLAANLTSALPRNAAVEVIENYAMKYALQVQCAFLGWAPALQDALRHWMKRNHEATLAQDRSAMADVAAEFAGYINQLLEARRSAGDAAPHDVITSLMRSEVNGAPLREEEIVSIIRNWTGGEIGTISASVGILVQFLADNPELQSDLRKHPHKLPEAIEEILRIHGPLVTNRRRTTRPVTIGGRNIPAGELLTIFWVSANRDEEVFENPDTFQWGRDHSKNLLYGAGIHWCPGAPLARMELRILMEELLAQTQSIAPAQGHHPARAIYPASGYSQLHVTFR